MYLFPGKTAKEKLLLTAISTYLLKGVWQGWLKRPGSK